MGLNVRGAGSIDQGGRSRGRKELSPEKKRSRIVKLPIVKMKYQMGKKGSPAQKKKQIISEEKASLHEWNKKRKYEGALNRERKWAIKKKTSLSVT